MHFAPALSSNACDVQILQFVKAVKIFFATCKVVTYVSTLS